MLTPLNSAPIGKLSTGCTDVSGSYRGHGAGFSGDGTITPQSAAWWGFPHFPFRHDPTVVVMGGETGGEGMAIGLLRVRARSISFTGSHWHGGGGRGDVDSTFSVSSEGMRIVVLISCTQGTVSCYHTFMTDTLNNISTANVLFRVVGKTGKEFIVIERQMPHDTQYKVGSRIVGQGKVTEVIGRGRG